MTILPLGTNGFFPSFGRASACFAIRSGKRLIVLDAGSGLFRFAEPEGKMLLDGVDYIDLFLSHYHLDHTFGFYAAFTFFKGKDVTVYGMTDRKVFEDITRQGYFPINYQKEYGSYRWVTINEGNFETGNYSVNIRNQYHRGEGSLAFRFDFGLAYVTDSEPTSESVRFVQGVPLLLHEHEVLPNETYSPGKKLEDYAGGGHVSTIGAALIAKQGKVGKLVLIHHLPVLDEKKLKEAETLARSIFPKTFLAEDLKPIHF